MKQLTKTILRKIGILPKPPAPDQIIQQRINDYLDNGRKPWSNGYAEYKEQEIKKVISTSEVLGSFKSNKIPNNYGVGLDERVVEYAWIFSSLNGNRTNILDAGSTFNFEYLVSHPFIEAKDLFIHTYYPEEHCFFNNRISYIYGDLRELPYKDDFFEEIVCQSTIEHIDMDNSIYGYEPGNTVTNKSFEYLNAVTELERVLKPNGTLLLTFPFGKFENHGFFQQFDSEMLNRCLEVIGAKGTFELSFFRYLSTGWIKCTQEDCKEIYSYNPHTGVGKGEDGAAHCRSICCIKFIKK